MQYAIIKNGVVENIILADADFAASVGAVPSDGASIGYLWDGKSFSAPPASPAEVPQSVTMRQARLALLAAGLLPAVTAAIAALPEPDKSSAQITWEFAATVDRGFGMVPTLAASMGMTEAQIDTLFIEAAKL